MSSVFQAKNIRCANPFFYIKRIKYGKNRSLSNFLNGAEAEIIFHIELIVFI